MAATGDRQPRHLAGGAPQARILRSPASEGDAVDVEDALVSSELLDDHVGRQRSTS